MFSFTPIPHDEAARRIADLPVVTGEVMRGLLPELRAHAFTVAGLQSAEQMVRVKRELAKVPEGESWDVSKKKVVAELKAGGLDPKQVQRRAETLLRTTAFRAYAATRYQVLMRQRDVFPFWQYKISGKGNTRSEHKALANSIFPAGHPIWQRIFPPWGWGCECFVLGRTARSVERAIKEGAPSAEEAKAANLLPSQVNQPIIYTPDEADLISRSARLPGGISLEVDPTWGRSPWSEKGNLRPSWDYLESLYQDPEDKEAWEAFVKWSKETEISDGLTVAGWISGQAAKAIKAVKAVQAPPARALASVQAALSAVRAERETALEAVQQSAEALKQAVGSNVAARLVYQQFPPGSARALQLITEISPEIAAAEEAYSQAVKAAEKALEAARDAVSLPTAERGRVKLQGQRKGSVDAGAAIVERYTHADLLPEVKLQKTRKRREYHTRTGGLSSIHINANTTASTVAHEITHATEQATPELLRAAHELLLKRGGGVPAVPLRRLHPRAGYKANEITLEDEWKKRGGDHYCGKVYPSGRATELFTMGIERLHRDPLEFADNDPEYFEFVLTNLQRLNP